MTVNDKHRRRSIRLPGYDYSQPGAYFVTVCTLDRECGFGEIADGQMRLNALGEIVQACWYDLPRHFSHLEMDVFVVMPNHVHGVVVITNRRGEASGAATPGVLVLGPDASPLPHPVGTRPGSLGAIVQNFKSVSTRRINAIRGAPGLRVWQRNYYEHIVRNAEELHRIRQYIVNNPAQWSLDQENPAVAGVGAPRRVGAAPLRDDIDDLLGGIRP